MQLPPKLDKLILHSLEDQIAVIDQAGNILEVNLAWKNFGCENGLYSEFQYESYNYLDILSKAVASGDIHADKALQGITDVLAGKLDVFYFEYPCHSPDEKRWFTMRVVALYGDQSRSFFVISHHNVTHRKLAEERAEELAMKDSLTGLGNRRAFESFLSNEVKCSIRNQTPISLALIDVDYFKHYNDEFGHAAGDQCLSCIARILLSHARRPTDHAARIGGDEFALILGNTRLDVVCEIAESVLRAVNELKMLCGNSKQVTVSIGLISIIPDRHHSEDFLYKQVDKALYDAKSAGRNQVVVLQSTSLQTQLT